MIDRIRFILVICTFCLVASAGTVFADDGKAEGQLTVAGKQIKLAFAYASAQPGFFDKTREDVRVILSDVPLTAKALDDDFERIDMAKAGKLHCVELTIDQEKQPISVTVRHEAFKVSVSGGSTEDVFEAKTFDGKVIDGRIYRKSPGKSFEDIEYTYDVTFKVTITHKSK
jgi:hypothetical protein